ncbi:MAG: Penicillin-binding protein 2 [Nevskia sp.]|nr:Penicillin-binding protein 2 [Nevskia sp.]
MKNLHEEKQAFTTRVWIAAIGCLVMLSILVMRMTDLQVLEHDYYSTRADDNRMRLVPVPPVRGLVYDRNGALLAQNVPAFVLEITPEQLPGKLDDTLARLGQLVRLTDVDIARFRERMRKTPHYRAVALRSNLSAEEVARYEINRYDFQGVDVTAGLLREYPLGTVASHVVGYVSGITDTDLQTIDEASYQGLNQIGKTGIERSHEDQLRGQPGNKIIEANAGGRPLRELDYQQGHAGQNLYLTIDSKLQTTAEAALGELDGAAIAIDPRNGEVLALVSKPGFDPGPFVEGIDGDSYRALLEDPDRPLYNRALLGTYPPGSTIKPFMAAAGLIAGTLNPATKIFDPGYFQLPGVERKYRCYWRQGHGWVDLNLAMTKSCDVYFYQAALNMGIDRIDDVLGAFGFGHLSEIDIPHEKSGLLPTRDWKRRVYRQAWFPGETLNTGIGQGYLTVTPLQLAQAAARMAMRGAGFKPHMLHAIEDPATHNITAIAPEALPRVEAKDRGVFDRVIEAMELVMQPGGTAYAVFKDAPYRAAGKTGTAQVAGLKQDETYAPKLDATPKLLRDHALFIAFAPVDDPRIAVAVIAEHAGHGGTSAAPVARAMIDEYLLGKVLYNAPNTPLAPVVVETIPDEDSDDENPDAGGAPLPPDQPKPGDDASAVPP